MCKIPDAGKRKWHDTQKQRKISEFGARQGAVKVEKMEPRDDEQSDCELLCACCVKTVGAGAGTYCNQCKNWLHRECVGKDGNVEGGWSCLLCQRKELLKAIQVAAEEETSLLNQRQRARLKVKNLGAQLQSVNKELFRLGED